MNLDTRSGLTAALTCALELGMNDFDNNIDPRTADQILTFIKPERYRQGHKRAIKAAYMAGRFNCQTIEREIG